MRVSAALFGVAIAITGVVAQESVVPTLEMDWNTIDVGGGLSEADGYSMAGTIGQSDVAADGAGGGAVMSGGGFEFRSGFWHGVQNVCFGDVAPVIGGESGAGSDGAGGGAEGGDGAGRAVGDGVVNVQDLLAIINHWGTNHFLYDIAPPGGDGTVNVLDMIAVLNAWGACPG